MTVKYLVSSLFECRAHIEVLEGLTISIDANLFTGFPPVLHDCWCGLDDSAVHVEKQSGEVDDFCSRRKIVVFMVRHLGCDMSSALINLLE